MRLRRHRSVGQDGGLREGYSGNLESAIWWAEAEGYDRIRLRVSAEYLEDRYADIELRDQEPLAENIRDELWPEFQRQLDQDRIAWVKDGGFYEILITNI